MDIRISQSSEDTFENGIEKPEINIVADQQANTKGKLRKKGVRRHTVSTANNLDGSSYVGEGQIAEKQVELDNQSRRASRLLSHAQIREIKNKQGRASVLITMPAPILNH